MPTVTELLVDALIERKFADLPDAMVNEAKRLTVDFLGVGLAGSRTESGRIAGTFAVDLAGPADAHVLGQRGMVSSVHAAFANAISSHSVELDDIDVLAMFHFAPPIVSVALAVGEREHSSGEEMITAIIAGCEMMNRLSRATNPFLRNRGFHTTPTCGVFGATVTAGLLLGLTKEQMVNSLGLAGAQASGLMEMYGTSMQKRFNPGPAARNGVTSALMALGGFTGADSIIEGERGFAAAFAGAFDRDVFLEDLGTGIPVEIEYKPYSCARPIHNAIDTMLELRERDHLTASEVKTVTVYRHPDWAKYHGISHPRTFHEAQMSLPYSMGVALVHGKALPEVYSNVGKGDDDAMRISEMVKILPEPSLLRGVSCRAVVETTDGRELVSTVDYPRGSLQRPLNDEELTNKFRSLAGSVLETEQVDQLAKTIWNLESLDDARTIGALATGQDLDA